VSGFAVPFREYRWHQPAERHFSESGNRWVGAQHAGVQWRPPTSSAPSFPMVSSRSATTMASRPRH
jgi:hypothetical protein